MSPLLSSFDNIHVYFYLVQVCKFKFQFVSKYEGLKIKTLNFFSPSSAIFSLFMQCETPIIECFCVDVVKMRRPPL